MDTYVLMLLGISSLFRGSTCLRRDCSFSFTFDWTIDVVVQQVLQDCGLKEEMVKILNCPK